MHADIVFPGYVSFTVTNACNLRCRMCGQWSEQGYLRHAATQARDTLSLEDWKRLVDEAAEGGIGMILIRGGEPFLMPGIIELIEYIVSKGIFSDQEYRVWFEDPVAPVRSPDCFNAERLIDIQPNGEANCCVDFPDYSFGNVREATLGQLFSCDRARRFRERRREKPFSACHRCGAKYMAMIRD